MMRKNELTSCEKDGIRRSKETTVITTASGKAEATKDATVYVNESDAFVIMMLFEDSHFSTTSGFIMRRTGLLL